MTPVPERELGPLPALDAPDSLQRLREKIAVYHGVSTSEVLPAFGTTHGLWAAYTSLLAPGDEALVEVPTYEPLVRIAEGVGARVIRFERPASERFALDPGRVRAAITPRTKVVAVTNLHNPGGVRAPTDALREVARIAGELGAHLLVDEVYAPFDAMTDARGVWTGSARNLAPNVVVASSLTKVYGLGARRIGWVLAPSEVIARGEDAMIASLGHPPDAWSALAAQAFEALPALADRARSLLAGKRARVEAWVRAKPRLTWSAPSEGLFGFAVDSSAGDLTATIERGAAQHGVLVAAGAFFGVPNGFRLSWSIDGATLEDGLERLGRVVA
jgi:aspartate/methionine/tyrosine aminotransferase